MLPAVKVVVESAEPEYEHSVCVIKGSINTTFSSITVFVKVIVVVVVVGITVVVEPVMSTVMRTITIPMMVGVVIIQEHSSEIKEFVRVCKININDVIRKFYGREEQYSVQPDQPF
jgi:CRISPR/Cas system type I-B associated protein Csh2 (Cas7 group RAMP superfamily)